MQWYWEVWQQEVSLSITFESKPHTGTQMVSNSSTNANYISVSVLFMHPERLKPHLKLLYHLRIHNFNSYRNITLKKNLSELQQSGYKYTTVKMHNENKSQKV